MSRRLMSCCPLEVGELNCGELALLIPPTFKLPGLLPLLLLL